MSDAGVVFAVLGALMLIDSIWCRVSIAASQRSHAANNEAWNTSINALRKDRDRIRDDNEKLNDLVGQLRSRWGPVDEQP